MDKKELLRSSFDMVYDYIQSNGDINLPVVKFLDPSGLSEVIDFKIDSEPITGEELLANAALYLEYSVRTGNKQFLNQLYSGFNLPAFIGDMVTVAANTSMYTYEVAPVATTIEKEMVELMCSYAGYRSGDGLFVTGGSNANLVAMFSARNRILPESRLEGYDRSEKLRIFVNERAHYSIETAANVLGFGSLSIIKIKSDNQGCIIPAELEKEIISSLDRGERPFFAVATCGTTILGAYDPINEMADICSKYNIWLHADGSFGGSVLLSEDHRYLMDGIERTDSLAWNPHKLMNIPLVCSVLLVSRKDSLYENITDINADYIFHDIDEAEDLGKKSIQCGRRVDAVKLWFAWKFYGKEGYGNRINNSMAMAAYAEKGVIDMPELELVVPRNSFTVCFRYIPEQCDDLNAFNLSLREKLRKSGKSMVNFGYSGKVLTIRLVIANSEVDSGDIDNFLRFVYETGKELERKQ